MDIIVKLKDLPKDDNIPGIIVRRAQLGEKGKVQKWIQHFFGSDWADEACMGFSNDPISVYLAIRDKTIVGFSAYECVSHGYFGPIGVEDSSHKKGIGKLLLLRGLKDLSELNYNLGVIPDVGDSIGFYKHVLGPSLLRIY